MNTFFIIAGTVIPVIVTVVITSIRIEHRLTKVETEIGWLKHIVGKITNCSSSDKES